VLDWNTNLASPVDARLFYFQLSKDSWVQCRWNPTEMDVVPNFYSYSNISKQQVCFTTEALKYAQSGYLISIVCVQWSDLMICKTRTLSISQQGMLNWNSNFALVFETLLVAALSYIKLCNLLLGTRMIAFPHFAVPSFSYFAIIMFYDECRKVYLRNGMVVSRTTGRTKFDGWVVRNTYY
jgi:sodium/potassium-transporting ATPase subunit alpha